MTRLTRGLCALAIFSWVTAMGIALALADAQPGDRITLDDQSVVAILQGYPPDLGDNQESALIPTGANGRALEQLVASFLRIQFSARPEPLSPEMMNSMIHGRPDNEKDAIHALAGNYTHVITIDQTLTSGTDAQVVLTPSTITDDARRIEGHPVPILIQNDNSGNITGRLSDTMATQLMMAFQRQDGTTDVKKTVSIGCIIEKGGSPGTSALTVAAHSPDMTMAGALAAELPTELGLVYSMARQGNRPYAGKLYSHGYAILNPSGEQNQQSKCPASYNSVHIGATEAVYTVSGSIEAWPEKNNFIMVRGEFRVRGPHQSPPIKPENRIYVPELQYDPTAFGRHVITNTDFVQQYIDKWIAVMQQ